MSNDDSKRTDDSQQAADGAGATERRQAAPAQGVPPAQEGAPRQPATAEQDAAPAPLTREERIRQKEEERRRIAEEKERARQQRIRETREKARLRQKEKHEAAVLAAAERLPDRDALAIARKKLLERHETSLRRAVLRFVILVILPTALSALYMFFIATPTYQASSSFTIETSEGADPAAAGGLFGLGGTPVSLKDAFMAREFILSRPMMEYMERNYGFISHFKGPDIDWLTRFREIPWLGLDDYWNYKRKVRVDIDIQSGILRLKVEALAPQKAMAFANAILQKAEEQVNLLSRRIYHDQVASMKDETVKAEQELENARRSVVDLQIRYGELNPRETVAAVYKLLQDLEARIKETERRRDVELRSTGPNNPIIKRLNSEIAVLRKQLSEQKARLVGSGKKPSLNDILAKFEYANIRQSLAEKRWESTLNSLERTRQEALRKRRYLTVIAPPAAPKFPARLEQIKTVLFIFFALLILYMALSILITAVRIRSR